MIDIKYNRKTHELNAVGHAGYATEGQDIVCASVSALCCTLAATLDPDNSEVKLHPGDIYIKSGSKEYDSVTTLIFDVICNGLEMIAQEYADYVRYESL